MTTSEAPDMRVELHLYLIRPSVIMTLPHRTSVTHVGLQTSHAIGSIQPCDGELRQAT
jgi:hypothetical protein